MTVFLVVGAAGLLLLLVSLVLGDLLDGAVDGLLHGVGGFFEALAGDVFSTAVIGAFVSAFGFGGAAVDAAGAPTAVSVLVGVVAGVVFAAFAVWLTRLVRGGSDAVPSPDDAIGREGTVISSIPDGGFGTVRVRLGGHTLQLNARCEQPLAPGSAVHVTGVLSPTAVSVAPVWPAGAAIDALPTPPDPV